MQGRPSCTRNILEKWLAMCSCIRPLQHDARTSEASPMLFSPSSSLSLLVGPRSKGRRHPHKRGARWLAIKQNMGMVWGVVIGIGSRQLHPICRCSNFTRRTSFCHSLRVMLQLLRPSSCRGSWMSSLANYNRRHSV